MFPEFQTRTTSITFFRLVVRHFYINISRWQRAWYFVGVSVCDDALVGAAVGEILKSINNCNDENEIVDDCLLVSAAAKVHGDQNMAMTEVQKAIRRCTTMCFRTGVCKDAPIFNCVPPTKRVFNLV